MDGQSCLRRLAAIVKEGRFLEELRTNPIGIGACFGSIAGDLMHRYAPHDPPVIGDDAEIRDDVLTVAEALDLNVQMGPFDLLVQMLIQRLFAEAMRLLDEYLSNK